MNRGKYSLGGTAPDNLDEQMESDEDTPVVVLDPVAESFSPELQKALSIRGTVRLMRKLRQKEEEAQLRDEYHRKAPAPSARLARRFESAFGAQPNKSKRALAKELQQRVKAEAEEREKAQRNRIRQLQKQQRQLQRTTPAQPMSRLQRRQRHVKEADNERFELSLLFAEQSASTPVQDADGQPYEDIIARLEQECNDLRNKIDECYMKADRQHLAMKTFDPDITRTRALWSRLERLHTALGTYGEVMHTLRDTYDDLDEEETQLPRTVKKTDMDSTLKDLFDTKDNIMRQAAEVLAYLQSGPVKINRAYFGFIE